jgi:hypothetical protein
MSGMKYLKIRCKGDLKQAQGSMFVVIEEEDEETCEFKIINESAQVEINYTQHIVSSPIWNERLGIVDQQMQKCKVGSQNRFTWESVLHQ